MFVRIYEFWESGIFKNEIKKNLDIRHLGCILICDRQ